MCVLMMTFYLFERERDRNENRHENQNVPYRHRGNRSPIRYDFYDASIAPANLKTHFCKYMKITYFHLERW